MERLWIPVLCGLAFQLDRERPSLGAMNAFFSLGVLDEATRRVPFVQQISSSSDASMAKVQTMPAEPMLRLQRDTAQAAARVRAVAGSAPW
jgi:hypothetical protein